MYHQGETEVQRRRESKMFPNIWPVHTNDHVFFPEAIHSFHAWGSTFRLLWIVRWMEEEEEEEQYPRFSSDPLSSKCCVSSLGLPEIDVLSSIENSFRDLGIQFHVSHFWWILDIYRGNRCRFLETRRNMWVSEGRNYFKKWCKRETVWYFRIYFEVSTRIRKLFNLRLSRAAGEAEEIMMFCC